MSFKIYLTDSLYYSAQNMQLSKRYFDVITAPVFTDGRSGEEIAADLIKRMGLTVE